MTSIPIHCPGCHVPLGLTAIETQKGIRLLDGKMSVEQGSMHCPGCGRMFFWRSKDYDLGKVREQFDTVGPVG